MAGKPGARRRRPAPGQVAVIMVLALPVLLLSISLCVDVGNLYVNRTKIQTAVDAAALAGANWLPDYQSQAITTAKNYAITNGIKSSEIESVTVATNQKSLTVTVSRDVPCYFCMVMGEGTAYASSGGTTGVRALAIAGIVPISAAYGVVPLAIDYRTDLSFGNEVTLKMGQVGAGNWDPLALGGQGASIYRSNLADGYQGQIKVGDELSTETGNVVGPTNQGITTRLSAGQTEYPSGTFMDHELDDPRILVVPIVDFSNINGNSQVPLKGFAVMWIEGSDQQGNLTCYFMHQSVPDATVDTTATSYGASSAVLLQ